MKLVNILETKTDFPKLVRQIETGEKDTIIVARYGNPVAKLVAYEKVPVEKRFGIAKAEDMLFLTHDPMLSYYEENCIVMV